MCLVFYVPRAVRPDPPLTAKELAEIIKSKTLSDSVKVRAYAVFLASQGLSIKDVADIVGFSDKSVRQWIKLWNSKGLDGLKPKKRAEENQV